MIKFANYYGPAPAMTSLVCATNEIKHEPAPKFDHGKVMAHPEEHTAWIKKNHMHSETVPKNLASLPKKQKRRYH